MREIDAVRWCPFIATAPHGCGGVNTWPGAGGKTQVCTFCARPRKKVKIVLSTEQMQGLHRELWVFRDFMDAHTPWKNMPTSDALHFASSEMGETWDAYLRIQGGFVRNHDRQPTVNQELADWAMMMMTALGYDHVYLGREVTLYPLFAQDVVLDAVEAEWCLAQAKAEYFRIADTEYTWQLWLEAALWIIADSLDLPLELEGRLRRIADKNGVVWASIPFTG